ncbi:hypothetical protein SAMN05444351_2348 [Geodermatophilus nigrescens]|uniref:ScyD/ScyE family protein n=1 Tax=Geodermatophilus nigrescens TaxID=1070870 RepID=A0A1M5J4I6_9ACTN|nr:hypothetical protein SAMN05444351_2348 [Geodermatophilus nigrescens]
MGTPRRVIGAGAALLLLGVAAPGAAGAAPPAATVQPQLLVTGLDGGGSGSAIGPGGDLYVTEPASGELTRIDRRTGATTPVADCLPPLLPEVGPGGAMDVDFLGGTAYVLVTLVGADLGGDDVVGVYRVDGPHTCTVVADIGTWSQANPPEGFEIEVPTGVQYAMESWHGGFLVTDGHHNRVLHVTLDGGVREVLALGNVVPTGLSASGHRVLLALAGPIPHLPENGRVVAFRPGDDDVREVASGGRLLVDVERGRGGVLALSQGEFTEGNIEGSPADPDTGQLLRVTRDGGLAPVAGPFDRPTSMEVVGRTAYVVTLDGEVWTARLHG